MGVSTEGKGGLLGRVYKERPKRFWYLLVCLEEYFGWTILQSRGGEGMVFCFLDVDSYFCSYVRREQILRGENLIEVFILACCLGIM